MVLLFKELPLKFKIEETKKYVYIYKRKWFHWEKLDCYGFYTVKNAFYYIQEYQCKNKSFTVKVIVRN